MFAIEVSGLDTTAAEMIKASAGILAATEYALASTAKMIRNKVKDGARGRGAYQFETNPVGWKALSPFTGTISKGSGASKEAYMFARKAVKDFGWLGVKDKFINQSAIDSERLSGRRTTALRKEIKRAQGKSVGFKTKTGDKGRGTRDYTRKVKLDNRSQPFARMISFVRSRIFPDQGRALIGLFSNDSSNTPDSRLSGLVEKHSRGFTFPITGKMRRFLFAVGAPTSASSVNVPARPWFSKVFAMIQNHIHPWFDAKFKSRMKPFIKGVSVTGASL